MIDKYRDLNKFNSINNGVWYYFFMCLAISKLLHISACWFQKKINSINYDMLPFLPGPAVTYRIAWILLDVSGRPFSRSNISRANPALKFRDPNKNTAGVEKYSFSGDGMKHQLRYFLRLVNESKGVQVKAKVWRSFQFNIVNKILIE